MRKGLVTASVLCLVLSGCGSESTTEQTSDIDTPAEEHVNSSPAMTQQEAEADEAAAVAVGEEAIAAFQNAVVQLKNSLNAEMSAEEAAETVQEMRSKAIDTMLEIGDTWADLSEFGRRKAKGTMTALRETVVKSEAWRELQALQAQFYDTEAYQAISDFLAELTLYVRQDELVRLMPEEAKRLGITPPRQPQ